MRIKHFIFIASLAAAAGAAKAIRDTLTHHFSGSIFENLGAWWNPAESWKLKYKDFDGGDTSAAFPFSKTLLVSLTDAWHLFDLLHMLLLIAAGIWAGWVLRTERSAYRLIWLGLLLISMFGSFHLLYTYVL